jgi:hypothetical protein
MRKARPVLVWCTGLIAGCAGSQGGTAAGDRERDRERVSGPSLSAEVLAAPFERRQGVVCNHVEMEISPEFYVELTTPARNPFHRHERVPGPPVEYRFVNESGDLTFPISLAFKNLRLTVLESAVVRVPEGGPRRLNLTASGAVVLVGEDGTRRTFETLSIRDGDVSASAQ